MMTDSFSHDTFGRKFWVLTSKVPALYTRFANLQLLIRIYFVRNSNDAAMTLAFCQTTSHLKARRLRRRRGKSRWETTASKAAGVRQAMMAAIAVSHSMNSLTFVESVIWIKYARARCCRTNLLPASEKRHPIWESSHLILNTFDWRKKILSDYYKTSPVYYYLLSEKKDR